MSNLAIKLDNVSKLYKLYRSPGDRIKEALSPFNKKYHQDYFALKSVNLEVEKGEVLGVVGKNGSGKSTLLKLISGVLVPNGGKVITKGKISALLELGSGFNPNFTGLQNVFFYGAILGIDRKDMEEKLDDILAFADIGEFIYQQLKTYSSGMKARLGFAVAVHVDPEILILDEVLSVGDALFKRKCYAKMDEFFKSGKTILYVSHNADSVNRLCTRAILLNDGGIVMDSDAKSVTAYYHKLLYSESDEAESSGEKHNNEDEKKDAERLMLKGETSSKHYARGLVSKSLIEYKNDDVLIRGAKIVDSNGAIVNILNFNKEYEFIAEVEFKTSIDKVSFGFEIKDEKGVRLATVDSVKMYRSGVYFSMKQGKVFSIKYRFRNLFRAGMYYVNFGVSSFEDGQKVLSRIIDVMVFKVVNNEGYSSGCIDLVESVDISDGENTNSIEILT